MSDFDSDGAAIQKLIERASLIYPNVDVITFQSYQHEDETWQVNLMNEDDEIITATDNTLSGALFDIENQLKVNAETTRARLKADLEKLEGF